MLTIMKEDQLMIMLKKTCRSSQNSGLMSDDVVDMEDSPSGRNQNGADDAEFTMVLSKFQKKNKKKE